MFGELFRGRVQIACGESIELLVAGASASVRDPLAILAEVEFRNALASVRDPSRFSTVRPHEVQLISGGRVLGGVSVREEDEKSAIFRPTRRGLLLVPGERQLSGRVDALLCGDQIEIR